MAAKTTNIKKQMRRECKFTAELAKDFPYIKKAKTSDAEVFCEKCSSKFSIAAGGRRDITRHLQTDKHTKSVNAAAGSSGLSTFFRKTAFGDEEASLALAETVFAFHTVVHNQSFRSMDCTSKIIQRQFQKKFSCARTKTEAIIKKVLAPFAISELKQELENVDFISIFSDASNHKDVKLFPTIIRFFSLNSGIVVKILDVVSLPGETSELISTHLIEILNNFNLTNKLVAYCADNANTNFGGVARKGTKNIFHILNEKVPQKILGIGCSAHIINNAIQTATDLLPIDIDTIINKIYSHFYIFTIRVETLKTFCEEADLEYRKLLSNSKTRWLSLLPAIERILKLYIPLKSYFLSIEKCPVYIENFFKNDTSELWLKFMHSQASLFSDSVKNIEGNKSTVVEVSRELKNLILKLKARLDAAFLPLLVKQDLKKLTENGLINEAWFISHVQMFYKNSLDYLELWSAPILEVSCFEWIELKTSVSWEEVQNSLKFIKDHFPDNDIIDENILFDQTTYLRQYASEQKILSWNNEGKPIDLRWVEMFNYFKEQKISFHSLQKIIEYSLCLPGTNAPTERQFSLINNYWTTEKSQMSIDTLKASCIVRCNIASSCGEFTEKIKDKTELLKKSHSAEKYL